MFEFELGEKVKEVVTGIEGKVIGRADYLYNNDLYLVRWKNKNETANEEWYPEKQIEKVEE